MTEQMREEFNKWNNDVDCPLAGLDVKKAAFLAWKASRKIQEKELSDAINLLAEMYDWAQPEITKYMSMWEGRRDKEIASLQKILSDVQSTIEKARNRS